MRRIVGRPQRGSSVKSAGVYQPQTMWPGRGLVREGGWRDGESDVPPLWVVV
jgi:hypothetical protein